MTVRSIYEWLDTRAPFDTQADFDNSGLLVGDPDAAVTAVHFALDLTDTVLDEAIREKAQLIITHHPMPFHAMKAIREDTYEGHLLLRLIRANIALISCHTCLDKASGGMNDVLAGLLQLRNVTGEDFLRVGDLQEPMTAGEAAERWSKVLHTTIRVMGPADRKISRVGMCTGAGSEEWEQAHALGADAFVSGEIKHHHALAAVSAGVICFECGHFATENPGIFALADALQNHANQVQ